MAFKLPPLPYPETALEPHISARTLQFHHGKHHKKYVDTLNQLIEGTEFANQSLEEIILATADDLAKQKIFNNAAQTWNHTFFWQCLSPDGGGRPEGELMNRIQADFGSFDKFRQEFSTAAQGQFGSGWAWLTEDGGKLKIMTTSNAGLPLVHGETALLTCDVWEHAYYLDYQNDRAKFVDIFLSELANWEFAQQQLDAGGGVMNTKDKLGSAHDGVEGEGSYSGTRDYQKGLEKTMKSGKVEEKAQEAKRAFEGPEGEELRRAEQRGQMAAKMEDPALRSKKKNSKQQS